MALKLGAENKRNVVIAGGLVCVVAYLGLTMLTSGPATPAPTAGKPATITNTTRAAAGTGSAGRMTISSNRGPGGAVAGVAPSGPAARQVPGTGLDPALHLERLALSESIDYAGTGRNIFSMDSTPMAVEEPVASARPQATMPVVQGPPPVPQPPAIDLRYFGYSSTRDGKREAYFVHGEDIFQAAAGDIVNHRYKVVAVDVRSVQVTDLSYNNTQTLPLVAN